MRGYQVIEDSESRGIRYIPLEFQKRTLIMVKFCEGGTTRFLVTRPELEMIAFSRFVLN